MKTLLTHILILTFASLTAATAAPSFSCCAQTDAHEHPRADAYAPISVMNDHTHKAGGWMLSYRFMQMEMDGMRHGNDRVSSADVFASDGIGYNVTPEKMTMNMQMLGVMYAPTDKFTLMLMANYLDTEMDHRINPLAGMLINANGGSDKITTNTDGPGDTKLSALYKFYEKESKRAHVALGLSVPTGSIDEKDKLPSMMAKTRVNSVLPAPMQLGSGTYDLLPSITWLEQFDNWSYGSQASGIIRLEDKNDQNYRLGHVFELTNWASTNLAEWISLSTGLAYKNTGKPKGNQKDVNQGPMIGRHTVTTAYGDNYGGERIDFLLGLNLLGTSGALKGHGLSADIRLPVWQDLNGYQLETDWTLSIGWRKAF
jgi:hypothetical protein